MYVYPSLEYVDQCHVPTFVSRLTPTLWAWTEPAIVTHGTPMKRDSHVVVVPAYGNVSRLQKQGKVQLSVQREHWLWRTHFLNIHVKIQGIATPTNIFKLNLEDPKCDKTSHLMSIKEYACMWSWLRWMSGSKSTRNGSKPNSSSVDKNFCLILSQQNGLHLTTSRELGTAHNILAQTCNTFGVIWQQ